MSGMESRITPDFERIQQIVRRHEFPSFVTGFDVHFDATAEVPTVWVAFRTTDDPARTEEAITARGDALHDLRVAVQKDIYNEVADWAPRFVFENEGAAELH